MTDADRVTDDDVLEAFRAVSDANEALSAREVAMQSAVPDALHTTGCLD